MIKVEVQYFKGYPHSDEMIYRVKDAIAKIEHKIDYTEVLVDTPEKVAFYRFRVSPTVLINDKDLENLPEPDTGNLACRYYKNGIPSTDVIIQIIKEIAIKGE